MLKKMWQKANNYKRKSKKESLRTASKKLSIPKSTLHYQEQRQLKRQESSGTEVWDADWGQLWLKRMIISVIYSFGIKAGVGSPRLSEHFKHLQIEGVAAVSASSIQRLTKEIEGNILWYKELQENSLLEEAKTEKKQLKALLGIDETWLEEMLLICQELSSGYLFLRKQVQAETQRVGGKD